MTQPSLQRPTTQISNRLALGFWILAIVAIFIWARLPGTDLAWDVHVYRNAIHAMSIGHDPYVDGIAVQQAFHNTLALHPNWVPPYTYVYSPLTLPLLRAVGALPVVPVGIIYWLLIAASMVATIYVGYNFAEPEERPIFVLLTPLALLFPGLLLNDVLFSGNIAFIFYGLVFLAALRGWRHGKWAWFYIAVLAASCFKAPMLSLLAAPVFSARKQWIPTLFTGAAGIALFAMQPHLWPALFRNYLQAVELQFSYNHDFGISPAGILADALYFRFPYQHTSAFFYLFYALLFAVVLFYLSRKFFAGYLTLDQWVPVLMPGIILLNPRIMEYDIAPITLMMALILWRVAKRSKSFIAAISACGIFLVIINICATTGWRTAECLTLVGLFIGGCVDLALKAQHAEALSRRRHPSPFYASPESSVAQAATP